MIKNALIPDYKSNSLKNQFILYDNKIKEISSQKPSVKVSEVIDLKEKILLPGSIDAHVHFNDPGFNDHEDFTTGSQAAAAGGITTVVDMPCTSIPPVTSLANLNAKLDVIKSKSLIDFALWGGVRGNDYPEIQENIQQLWESGIVGFKIYTISGMESFKALTYQQIDNVLESNHNKLFAFHAEDEATISANQFTLKNSPLNNWQRYLDIRSISAEVIAIDRILSLEHSSHLHFVHVSSKKGAELIISAKKSHNITWETCPQYLAFTCEDFQLLRGRLKTAPPVKYQEDKEFLNNCLLNSQLDYITTDHAGSDFDTAKNLPDFSKIYNGIPGTQLMIPFLASNYLLNNKISPVDFVNLTSGNAAKRLGLSHCKGSFDIGTDADFTVIDPNSPLEVDESKLYSKGKYSPFVGQTFSCSINATIIRGEVVYEKNRGFLVKPGFGKWIKSVR